jgi:RAT1-interacting protein
MVFFFLGLKTAIEEGGTWRLRKAEKSSAIEAFKVEETGTGDILSEAFLAWRTKT